MRHRRLCAVVSIALNMFSRESKCDLTVVQCVVDDELRCRWKYIFTSQVVYRIVFMHQTFLLVHMTTTRRKKAIKIHLSMNNESVMSWVCLYRIQIVTSTQFLKNWWISPVRQYDSQLDNALNRNEKQRRTNFVVIARLRNDTHTNGV